MTDRKYIASDCRMRHRDGDSDWQPAEIIQHVSVTRDEKKTHRHTHTYLFIHKKRSSNPSLTQTQRNMLTEPDRRCEVIVNDENHFYWKSNQS